jgi:hypothetical protein
MRQLIGPFEPVGMRMGVWLWVTKEAAGQLLYALTGVCGLLGVLLGVGEVA